MKRLISVIACAFCAISINGATIHVPGNQPTILAGIDVALAGDTVLVACDTYYEHDIIMKSEIVLRSEAGQASCVTIDAQQLGRVFYCKNLDGASSIEGFTITRGITSGMEATDYGGGMYCDSASVSLINCWFSENWAQKNGGGMSCNNSDLTLTNCSFSFNTAWDGGGLVCTNSSLTLYNCSFSSNTANDDAGGAVVANSDLTFVNCTFSSNESSDYGGAMYCLVTSSTLNSCIFSYNTAGHFGGGICYNNGCTSILTNCIFSNNSAIQSGGGISCWMESSTILENTIISYSIQGEAIHCTDGSSVPTLTCCDLFGNAGGDWVGCIANQADTNGNFSLDPLFCDTANQDYHITCASPCSPTHNSCSQLIGALDIACQDCFVRSDLDHDGNVNVSDLTYLVAYLFLSGPRAECPEEGNVDADGGINVADLTYLVDFLFFEGPAPPPCT